MIDQRISQDIIVTRKLRKGEAISFAHCDRWWLHVGGRRLEERGLIINRRPQCTWLIYNVICGVSCVGLHKLKGAEKKLTCLGCRSRGASVTSVVVVVDEEVIRGKKKGAGSRAKAFTLWQLHSCSGAPCSISIGRDNRM